MMSQEELLKLYEEKKDFIKQRLQDFKRVFNLSDGEIFAELSFCLLTPQTKAQSADKAIKRLVESGMLLRGDERQIERYLQDIRFPENKAKYIVAAREFFFKPNKSIKALLKSFVSPFYRRDWLVKNVKGFGYKEASHFLRNIGMGENLAILDRHVMRNLVEFGVIKEVPKSLTPKRYFEIENKMRKFSQEIGIPFAELDLLFFAKETGEIFK